MVFERAQDGMDHRGEDEPPDAGSPRRLHHGLADMHLIRKVCRRDVEETIHAIERGANTGSVGKIAHDDLGRTVMAHIVKLIFVLYEAANRDAALGKLRYDEARKLAGRASRQNRGSVSYHWLIPGSFLNCQGVGSPMCDRRE
jgi:hypothetical protein